MPTVLTNHLTKIYGINKAFSKKTCKVLGLNNRVKLSFLKSRHTSKITSFISRIRTGKGLKLYNKNNIKFYKSLNKTKRSNFSLQKYKNDSKKSKKQTKKISKKK
jgi:ribosomal protein S13